MEQISKNQSAVIGDIDRIEKLHEPLILRILSFLPTKTVVATSVLSKQWRRRWEMVPNLKFDSEDHKSDSQYTFSEIVCKSFLSNQAPVLESLHLRFGVDRVSPKDIGVWIGIAFARNLRELVLDVLPRHDIFVFPSSLCTSNTLETLKLKLMILLDIPTPVLMKSLRTLHLSLVSYKDDESVRNLLSGCPILEDLVVDRARSGNVVTFAVDVPSLKTLSIYHSSRNHGEGFRRYLINTPSLKYLRVRGLKGFKFWLNAPQLVEVKFIEGSYIITEEFLRSLKSAKHLYLSLVPLEIMYPTSSIFYQLECLEICTGQEEWCNLLNVMLYCSPELKVLKLVDKHQNYGKDGAVWNEPNSVPECLVNRLETFKWGRYDCEREEEKEVATYILRNARKLKNVTFGINPIAPITWLDPIKLRKSRKIIQELANETRALDLSHLVFGFVEE